MSALALPVAGWSFGPRGGRVARIVGSLWSAAALGALLFSVHVATMVFREMPQDRLLAGRIAGRAFTGAYAITVVAAAIAFVVALATPTPRVDRAAAAGLLAGAALELTWVAPAIARHGAGWPGSFASLHAVGGGLHLTLAVLALWVAWRLLAEAPAERRST